MPGAFVLHDALVVRQKWLFTNLDVLKESVKLAYPRAQVNFRKIDPEASDKETTIDVTINGVLAYQAWWVKEVIINRPSVL